MNKSFESIEEELLWAAVVMSEGNIEATHELVKFRNIQREKEADKQL